MLQNHIIKRGVPVLSLCFSPVGQVLLGKPSGSREHHPGRGGGGKDGEKSLEQQLPKPKRNGGTGGTGMRGHCRDQDLENY